MKSDQTEVRNASVDDAIAAVRAVNACVSELTDMGYRVDVRVDLVIRVDVA